MIITEKDAEKTFLEELDSAKQQASTQSRI